MVSTEEKKKTAPAGAALAEGRVVQVMGVVVDAEFPSGKLPGIYNAVRIRQEQSGNVKALDIIAEVQHAGLRDVEWYHRGPLASRGETTERLYVLARKD